MSASVILVMLRAATYDHKARADVCTDPDCFEAKKKAHLKREADKAAAAGAIVVTGNAAKAALSAYGEVRGAYVALQKVDGGKKALATATRKAGDIAAPAVVTIQDPRTGKLVQAVKRDDLVKVGLAEPERKIDRSARDREDWQAKQKRDQAAAEVVTNARLQLLAKVRAAAAARPRSLEDLRVCALRMLQLLDDFTGDGSSVAELWGCRNVLGLATDVESMGPDDLGRLMLDCALIDRVNVESYDYDEPAEWLDRTAGQYGFFAGRVHAEASEAAGTPPTAARALEDAAGVATPQSAALAPARSAPLPIWPFPRRPGQAVPDGFRGADEGGASSAGQEVNDEAGSAGQEQTDDAGRAVGSADQVDADAEETAT